MTLSQRPITSHALVHVPHLHCTTVLQGCGVGAAATILGEVLDGGGQLSQVHAQDLHELGFVFGAHRIECPVVCKVLKGECCTVAPTQDPHSIKALSFLESTGWG